MRFIAILVCAAVSLIGTCQAIENQEAWEACHAGNLQLAHKLLLCEPNSTFEEVTNRHLMMIYANYKNEDELAVFGLLKSLDRYIKYHIK